MVKNRLIRVLHCPVCKRGHVMNEVVNPGGPHITLYTPEESQDAAGFLKCPKCGSQIGMSVE